MNESEKAQQQMNLITDAIAAVERAAEEERKVTHARHIDERYVEALNILDIKLFGAGAYARRVQTIGR